MEFFLVHFFSKDFFRSELYSNRLQKTLRPKCDDNASRLVEFFISDSNLRVNFFR